MKKINMLFAGVAIATLTGTVMASAADLPSPQVPAYQASVPVPSSPFSWSGLYFGVNGGYGSAGSNTVDVITGNIAGANGTYPNSGRLDGFVGGGTVGANHQSGRLVLGFEGDWDWTSQSLTKSVSCTGDCVATGHAKIRWISTLRGRVGYAFNRVLLYGTGGVAFMNAGNTQTQTVPENAPAVHFSDTALGWSAGAGIEYAITRNLSAKLEYLHVGADLSDTVAFPEVMGGGVESETSSISDDIVRAGLNWRFN